MFSPPSLSITWAHRYLHGCAAGIVIMGGTVLWTLLLDAIFIGVIFSRVARGQRRASTVCFTDKAVLRLIDGKLYFVFQVAEMRKHQLVEAHVRAYCIRSSQTAGSNAPIPFQTHLMRLQQPDDQLGSLILLSIPQQVVHRIDPWSPLFPPPTAPPASTTVDTPSERYCFPDVLQREADFESGNREVRPKGAQHPAAATLAAVEAHLRATAAEIMVLVEGIDPATSYTIQARHSYQLADIEFGAYFAPCVSQSEKGACVVDFDKFHQIEKDTDGREGADLHIQSHA